jgi:NAD(P) transhydrogenase
MRPTLGQCRAGIKSAASKPSSLAVLGMLTPAILLSSPAEYILTSTLAARHVRPFYQPTRKWDEQRKQLWWPKVTALTTTRYATVSYPVPSDSPSEFVAPVSTTPFSNLTIGVVRETYPNERRVAITPQNAALLLKKGFARVLVERGAGAEAQFTDQAYEKAGVTLGEAKTVWTKSDIILKVRAPSFEGKISEVDQLREGATLISFIYPLQNKKTVEKLASRGTTSFAMDMIPRISRAQTFDALRWVRIAAFEVRTHVS